MNFGKCRMILITLSLIWSLSACGAGATSQQMGTVAPSTSKPPSITTESSSSEEASDPKAEQSQQSTPEATQSESSQKNTEVDPEPQPEQVQDTAPIMTGYLAQNDVLQIAYDHAGVSKDQVAELSCHLEEDDSPVIYEIEFVIGDYEYEYEINAKTGDILDYDRSED